MFDAPIGYHQLAIAKASQEKLAFQGFNAMKWTYTVMPFKPTNGPATFVNFIYNIDSVWKELAKSIGVPVGDATNTRIIIETLSAGQALRITFSHNTMPAKDLPSLPPLIEPSKKPFLPKTIHVCWY
jgi:hypothetical protein